MQSFTKKGHPAGCFISNKVKFYYFSLIRRKKTLDWSGQTIYSQTHKKHTTLCLFGIYNIPENFWDLHIFDGFDLINREGFGSFKGFYANDDINVIEIIIQKENRINKQLIINRIKKDEIIKVNLPDGIFYYPIGVTEAGNIQFITYNSQLTEHLRKLDPDHALLASIEENEFDNPIIIEVKLMEN